MRLLARLAVLRPLHLRDRLVGARLDVLRLRNFRNLFLGEAASLLGDGLFPVALTWAVLDDLHASATALGLVLAAFSLPLVLFTLIGGVWADRLRRELVMIASDLVRLVTLGLIAALLLSGHAHVWSLAVLGFVYGCGDAFFFPAYTALIQQIVPAGRLQEANALRGMADGFGWFVGPSISGLLVGLIGTGGTLAIDALTFLVSAGFLLSLRVPALLRSRAPESFGAELRHGWHEVRSRRWLLVMMLRAMLVLFATIAPLQILGPLEVNARFHSSTIWGLLVGLFSLGMLAGGVLALYYRPTRPMVVVAFCGTTASVPMVALALRLSPAELAAVWFLRGVAIGLLTAVWDATLQRLIAPESMARVSSWDWMTSTGLWPLGLVLAGPIAQLVGLTDALWLSGAVGLGLSLWVLVVRDVWNLRDALPAPLSPGEAAP
jgi:MFS family permease